MSLPQKRGLPASEKGVALLTALLIVALATIVTVAMTQARQLSVQRSANLIHGEQAWAYGLGLEAWARSLLREDLTSGDRVDARSEAWAGRLPLIPVPGGRLTGSLDELNGRFNVNTLLSKDIGTLQMRRFGNLLGVLGLDSVLAYRLKDWLDRDREPEAYGAEDNAYTRLEPPYRTANSPLLHVSELRLLLGLNQAAWEKLAPHVSALPNLASIINVNTATVPVLMSLNAKITKDMAQALVKAGRAGFTSETEFIQSPILRGVPVDKRGLGVTSHYFLAHGVVELDKAVYHFYSLIQRGDNGMAVLRRTRGLR